MAILCLVRSCEIAVTNPPGQWPKSHWGFSRSVLRAGLGFTSLGLGVVRVGFFRGCSIQRSFEFHMVSLAP